MTRREYLLAGASLLPAAQAAGQQRSVDGTSLQMWGESSAKDASPRGQWLKDSRFAMFIHWGLYSELAGHWDGKAYYGISEWIMNRAKIPAAEYEKVARRFNPTGFDAREWVRTAKAAGMRHIMITSKHHDGFAMFKSAASSYNIAAASPFRRDPLKELSEACRAEGLRLGFYYSQSQDWHEKDAVGNRWDFPAPGNFQNYLAGKAIPQIKELLDNYGPLAGIWFDTPGPITPQQSKELVDLVHTAQPQCLVNSRIGNGLGDYDTLGDMEIPRAPRAGLWETVDTHNDSWGYSSDDLNFKTAREIAQRLVKVVSRGGVYMLNIGPDGKGRMPPQSLRMLKQVGAWVQANEAAIHGADPTPLGALAWGECTRRGSTLYLHVFDWPESGTLVVPGLKSKLTRAKLPNGTNLAAKQIPEGWVLHLPDRRPGGLIPVITLETEGAMVANRDLFVLGGHDNELDSGGATLTGCKPAKVQWMEKFGDWKHAECATEWTGAGSMASWTFQTVEPAEFYADVDYTLPAEDDCSEWRLTLDGKSVTFPLIDTGERPRRTAFGGALPRFRTYRIGLIQLEKPGPHQLELGPTGKEGQAARIAGITLRPAS
ncbi:alpha-L-fucosidase [Paludibaculum fermentans]|uniref:alpha-L-fucosidase n=1 Tax=Paludibaculum fermentans TaxID=1473598 RepID=A0A7S7NUU8_PALFE|nr:alpha-L-fucosidase [Paludibaculum fermentans]QOY90165.1 alpha-L-fucosidase [Paludibaculum fermentans]